MKKEIFQEVEIPEGVEVNVEKNRVIIKGPEGENKREFNLDNFSMKKEGNKIVIGNKKSTKNEKKLINTTASHLRNMIKGVQEKFEYNLLVCYSHFPISVEIKGNEATVKNFLGEKISRKVKLPEGIEIEVGKDSDKKIPITIKSVNRESAGQAAANLERSTRISLRDRRVFQDGIFITNKAGREL